MARYMYGFNRGAATPGEIPGEKRCGGLGMVVAICKQRPTNSAKAMTLNPKDAAADLHRLGRCKMIIVDPEINNISMSLHDQ